MSSCPQMRLFPVSTDAQKRGLISLRHKHVLVFRAPAFSFFQHRPCVFLSKWDLCNQTMITLADPAFSIPCYPLSLLETHWPLTKQTKGYEGDPQAMFVPA